ncbi:MAG: hypothetical protein K8T90_02680 [Planctomycetes bacterium]|nr:hypothetical protein [Planctomycetota bacterium]
MKRKDASADARAVTKAAKRILLGIGLDHDADESGEGGMRRITRARDALLVGGSKETHERMQETTIRFNEELDRRGMRLSDVRCADELREIADKAGM